jgi:hypothetical protein
VCTPRQTELPDGALAGVECRLEVGIAARVGAYRFADAREAALAYLGRMDGYGVAPDSGDCAANAKGERTWMIGGSGDTVEVDGSGPLEVGRIGCFLNENDFANVRLTCGSMYVGILGRNDDIAALHRWAWGSDRPSETGVQPDICRTEV